MAMIKDKVAIITGGASGIGFFYAKELLRNGLRGVCLADLNPTIGEKSVSELNQEFGAGKAIFFRTDVTNKQEFEGAFEKTIETFKNLDILINNAGILNDSIWERQIEININGTVMGSLLALEKYLPKHRSGPEGLIINISSIVGLDPHACLPVYTATKHAVLGFSRSLGKDILYDKTKIRVLTVCPGVTDTPLISDHKGRALGPVFEQVWDSELAVAPSQSPEHMGRTLIDIINQGETGSVWMTEGGKPACEIAIPDRNLRIKK